MTNPLPRQRICSAIVPIALVALFCLLSPPSSDAANGVHFDPESPAGKEYALPLDEARNEATGTGDQGPEGSGPSSGPEVETGESAPLFGEGVSGGSGDAGGSQGESGGGSESGGPSPPGEKGQGGGSSTGSATGQLAEGDESYPLLGGVGLAALVVAIGIGAGLALRGLRRVRPT